MSQMHSFIGHKLKKVNPPKEEKGKQHCQNKNMACYRKQGCLFCNYIKVSTLLPSNKKKKREREKHCPFIIINADIEVDSTRNLENDRYEDPDKFSSKDYEV